MQEFIASLVMIGLAILGMSVGLIFRKRPLRKTCCGRCETCEKIDDE